MERRRGRNSNQGQVKAAEAGVSRLATSRK